MNGFPLSLTRATAGVTARVTASLQRNRLHQTVERRLGEQLQLSPFISGQRSTQLPCDNSIKMTVSTRNGNTFSFLFFPRVGGKNCTVLLSLTFMVHHGVSSKRFANVTMPQMVFFSLEPEDKRLQRFFGTSTTGDNLLDVRGSPA